MIEDGEISGGDNHDITNSSTGHNRHWEQQQQQQQHVRRDMHHQWDNQYNQQEQQQQQQHRDSHRHEQQHHERDYQHHHYGRDEGRRNNNDSNNNYRHDNRHMQQQQQHRGRQQYRDRHQNHNRNHHQHNRNQRHQSPYQRPQDRQRDPSTPRSVEHNSNNRNQRSSSRSNTPRGGGGGTFQRSSSRSNTPGGGTFHRSSSRSNTPGDSTFQRSSPCHSRRSRSASQGSHVNRGVKDLAVSGPLVPSLMPDIHVQDENSSLQSRWTPKIETATKGSPVMKDSNSTEVASQVAIAPCLIELVEKQQEAPVVDDQKQSTTHSPNAAAADSKINRKKQPHETHATNNNSVGDQREVIAKVINKDVGAIAEKPLGGATITTVIEDIIPATAVRATEQLLPREQTREVASVEKQQAVTNLNEGPETRIRVDKDTLPHLAVSRSNDKSSLLQQQQSRSKNQVALNDETTLGGKIMKAHSDDNNNSRKVIPQTSKPQPKRKVTDAISGWLSRPPKKKQKRTVSPVVDVVKKQEEKEQILQDQPIKKKKKSPALQQQQSSTEERLKPAKELAPPIRKKVKQVDQTAVLEHRIKPKKDRAPTPPIKKKKKKQVIVEEQVVKEKERVPSPPMKKRVKQIEQQQYQQALQDHRTKLKRSPTPPLKKKQVDQQHVQRKSGNPASPSIKKKKKLLEQAQRKSNMKRAPTPPLSKKERKHFDRQIESDVEYSRKPSSNEAMSHPIKKRKKQLDGQLSETVPSKKRRIIEEPMEESRTKPTKIEKRVWNSLGAGEKKKKRDKNTALEEKRMVMVTTTPVALTHERHKKLISPSVVSDDVPTETSFLSSSSSSHMIMGGSIVSLAEAAATTDEWSSASPKSSAVPIVATTSVKDGSSKETPLGMKVNQVIVEVPPKEATLEAATTMDDSSSESDTDNEEVWHWAERMFGVTPPGLLKMRQEHQRLLTVAEQQDQESSDESSDEEFEFTDEVVEKPAEKFRTKPFTKRKAPPPRNDESSDEEFEFTDEVVKRPSETTYITKPFVEPKKKVKPKPFAEPKKKMKPFAEPKKKQKPFAEPQKTIKQKPFVEPQKTMKQKPFAEPQKTKKPKPFAEPQKTKKQKPPRPPRDEASDEEAEFIDEDVKRTVEIVKPKKKEASKPPPPSLKNKINQMYKDEKKKRKAEHQRKVVLDDKRKKEEAKPLTAAQIRAILGEEGSAPSSHWVRRSSRQPCKAALSAPGVRALLDKLRRNDSDMVVLKMKKYINDPDAPQVVVDAALDALEENSNCEALYIQNFNKGMHDAQVLHLLKILQLPTCKIWCINIGETYNVRAKTWRKFARGLKRTKVTHMYASEHTIDGEMKDKIRGTIRANRAKHDMHNNPENLDVIVQCTHCWWNPMNAKSLRPYLRHKGYEHILLDKEAQGLRGSTSGAAGADSAVSSALEAAATTTATAIDSANAAIP